ncbi:MAG: hypothetical protein GTN87_00155 [Hydrotalea flava]|nr:hypothetical protein [Hydrotalea flava]
MQIEVMPEGRHIDYSDVIYTDIKLFTVRDENPDIVLIDGDRYEVLACYEYQHDIINHYRAELKRQEQEL